MKLLCWCLVAVAKEAYAYLLSVIPGGLRSLGRLMNSEFDVAEC